MFEYKGQEKTIEVLKTPLREQELHDAQAEVDKGDKGGEVEESEPVDFLCGAKSSLLFQSTPFWQGLVAVESS